MESADLVFINIDPRSDSDPPEHRMVIRSKAGQHKRVSALPEALSHHQISVGSKSWKPYHRLRLKGSGKRKRATQGESLKKDRQNKTLPVGDSTISLRDAIGSLVLVLDQKIETLGGNTFDPFKSLPLPEVPEPVLSNSLWMFVYEYLPLFWAIPRSNSLDPRIQTLFGNIKESKSCLVACIFTALCHKRARERQAGIEEKHSAKGLKYHALFCQYEGTRLLRHEVEEHHELTSMNLMTMLLLGCSTWDLSNPPVRPAFTPFMQSLGLLDSMTEYQPERHHVDACFEYIKNRGGIESLGMDLLRSGLAYASVLDAARLGTQPEFPYSSLVAPKAPTTLQARLNFTSSDVEKHFGLYQSAGLSEMMMETFYGVREYEGLLGNHLRGMLEKMVSVEELADLRLLVEHHVLNLPFRLDCMDWKDTFYECCRLALRLYSIGVVFPMTLTSAPWGPITADLLQLLKQGDYAVLRKARDTHAGAFGMLAWAVVVGGISAYKTVLYEEFVSILRGWFIPELPDESFNFFKTSILSPILWFDYSCDTAGEALWKEACILEEEQMDEVSV